VYGGELDGKRDMEWDGDNKEKEDDEEEDDKNAKEEAEKEYTNVDDGKKQCTIGQGDLKNLWADDVDMMVDNQPTLLYTQSQVRRKHTTQEQPPLPAQLPQTLEPRPQP
jgi:hypothetical protein